MNDANTATLLARAFTENRERLLTLAARNLKPILLKRYILDNVDKIFLGMLDTHGSLEAFLELPPHLYKCVGIEYGLVALDHNDSQKGA